MILNKFVNAALFTKYLDHETAKEPYIQWHREKFQGGHGQKS